LKALQSNAFKIISGKPFDEKQRKCFLDQEMAPPFLDLV